MLPQCKTGANRVNFFRKLFMLCDFYLVLKYVCLHHFAMEQMSEVIRAEAETLFSKYANKYSNDTLVFDN